MKGISDSPIVKAFELTQSQNFLVFAVQTLHGKTYSPTVLGSLKTGQWFLATFQTRRSSHWLTSLMCLIQRTQTMPVLQVITAGVQCNTVQPRVKTALPSKRMEVFEGTHECVLNNVIRKVPTGNLVLNRGGQSSLISIDQNCVGTLIA